MLHSSSILNIFAQSPIKPMEKHMNKIHSCVVELLPFFEKTFQQSWDEAISIHKDIMQKEEEADELKKEIRLHLPNSLFLPVSRGDLLALLTSQDKIASKVKHISGLIVARKMRLPDTIIEKFSSFLNRCIDASAQARKAINELDELIETGFRGREVKIVEAMILQLNQIERDTDNMQVELRASLFSIEQTLDPINVIFLYKIIDWTGELADRAQHVGHQLESLLAH